MKEASILKSAGDYAGADAKMAEASRFPGLTKAAQRAQPDTQHTIRLYDTGQGFSLPKAYSTNMFRRFMMQKPFDAVMEGVLGNKVDFFSTAGKGRGSRKERNQQARGRFGSSVIWAGPGNHRR